MRKKMTDADRATILQEFSAIVNPALNECSSGAEFSKRLETTSANNRIDYQDDGAKPINDEKKKKYQNVQSKYADLLNKFANAQDEKTAKDLLAVIQSIEKDYPGIENSDGLDKALNDLCQNNPTASMIYAESELNKQKKATDNAYFKNEEEKKPVTTKDIDEAFADTNFSFDAGLFNNVKTHLTRPESKIFTEFKRRAAQADVPDNSELHYHQSTYTSNGKTVTYEQYAQNVNWGSVISKMNGTPEQNIEQLRRFITKQVHDYFGGWSRFQSIVIRDQQIIVNNVCYMPLVGKEYLKDGSVFPIDTLDYLKYGCIARCFDWSVLTKMHNLVLFDVDDRDIYMNDIANALGCNRNMGLSSIFNAVPSLEVVVIAGDPVTKEKLHSEEARVVKEKLSAYKRFTNFSDGYKLNICKGTNGLQDFTLNNLKNYATNRGNKGLFRYCMGTIARASLFAGAGVANLASHLAWGVKNLFSTAMSPVTEEDLNQ